MKFLTVLFAVLCLVAYSTQSPLFGECVDGPERDRNPVMKCSVTKCFIYKSGDYYIHKVESAGCPPPKCEEGKRLVKLNPGNQSAVYPDCCPTAVCETILTPENYP